MRPTFIVKVALLGLGTGVATLLHRHRRLSPPPYEPVIPAADLNDPVQRLGELDPLQFEDIDAMGVEPLLGREQDAVLDDEVEVLGGNWMEALETSAAENGPVGASSFGDLGELIDELPAEGSDDEDADAMSPRGGADLGDRPVADRGAGGPGGI